jgi:small subunit ribosomal protein S20
MAEDKVADKKKKGENVKKPSALKRDVQSERRRLRRRAFKSGVSTAIRSLESSLSKKEAPDVTKAKLDAIYSLMDKGVKKGVFKVNKASRTKSRLTARVKATV